MTSRRCGKGHARGLGRSGARGAGVGGDDRVELDGQGLDSLASSKSPIFFYIVFYFFVLVHVRND